MCHIAMYRIIVASIAVVFVGFPTASLAQVAAAQIKLTEKHVEGFIAAQRDMSAVAEKMQGSVAPTSLLLAGFNDLAGQLLGRRVCGHRKPHRRFVAENKQCEESC